MKKLTQEIILKNLIKNTAQAYKLSESEVEEAVCQVIAEVLTSEYGYKIDVTFINGTLKLIGRINQHGQEKDEILSNRRIKSVFFNTIENRLKHRLDFRQSQKDIIKYTGYVGSVVIGKIISHQDDNYYISFKLNDDEIIGICKLWDLPKEERNSIGKEFYFYISSLKKEILDHRIRITLYLSRRSKKFPNALLQHITSDDKIKLKCIKRNAGIISFYISNKPIKKKNIEKLSEALGGETIILRKGTSYEQK